MFLSVIIPVYNTEKYIAECLESCLNQDLSADDYEIICVNDGSTDRSLDILNDYSCKYSQIKVINKENFGVSEARNTGIKSAKGDYIWFVDSDDVIAPNCMNGLREKCIETNCDRLSFSLISFPNKNPSLQDFEDAINDETVEKSSGEHGYSVLSLMHRDFILSHNILFPKDVAYGEDQVFNYLWKAYRHSFVDYNRVLYFYRYNSSSAMGKLSQSNDYQIKRIMSVISILLWLRNNDVKYTNEDFKAFAVLEYVRLLRWMICGLMPKIPFRYCRGVWLKIYKEKLLSRKYLYIKNNKGKLIKKSYIKYEIYFEYIRKNLKRCFKH